MTHELKKLLISNLCSGLKRKSVTTTSAWAEAYRVMGRPFPGLWRFNHHPWTREMHDDESELIIGQKAAQLGFTEVCLNRSFKKIDIDGVSVLYVLPSEGDASDFSTSRFDPALELSPHLQNLFSNVKNIGHKRAGSANLYVRGSRSKSKLKSIPVGCIVFDEVDEMCQENITLAFERMSGQVEQQAFMISTPTIDNYGINSYFKASTQDHFFFRCPHCSKWTELIFPDCLVVTADDPSDKAIRDTHIICKECKQLLEHQSKVEWLKDGKWVPTYSDRLSRGFHINQLYSMTVEPWQLATLYLRAQSNPTDEQEFYNSKLGLTHAVKGAKITDSMLAEATKDFRMRHDYPRGGIVCMGIDVGKWLHVEIVQYVDNRKARTGDVTLDTIARVVWEGKLENFEDLDRLISQYGIMSCVIDNQPETREALKFANRFDGLVKLCIYGQGVNGKLIKEHSDEPKVTVDRTSWLDTSLGRFKNGSIHLPMDLEEEYKSHIKAPVRVYKEDVLGNKYGVYVCGNEEDHFAHARNYCEIALAIAVSQQVVQNIEKVK